MAGKRLMRALALPEQPDTRAGLEIGVPSKSDGLSAHNLVSHCPPLDLNAPYCYLLQCSHFAQTSACAHQDGQMVGFVSGYRIPEMLQALFIWQVAVAASMRGRGLGSRMIEHILDRTENADITELRTTVTTSNTASVAMFQRLAGRRGAGIERSVMFDRDAHFDGAHETEILFRISPLAGASSKERT